VVVTVTKTVDTETLVKVEALTVMVIELHDDVAAEDVELDETVIWGTMYCWETVYCLGIMHCWRMMEVRCSMLLTLVQ
jgi:hypothetical protein